VLQARPRGTVSHRVLAALTLAFEFGIGRFLSGLTWRQMLAEYNLGVAPYVFYRLWRSD
jgi:hypothetical protein